MTQIMNSIVQSSRYVFALLMALYTIRCFTGFFAGSEKAKRRNYKGQNMLMFMIHFLFYLIFYLNKGDYRILVFYAVQLCFFIAALFLYSNIYRNASLMLINNMFMLLMTGFAVLTRINMDLAVKQFGIAVVSVGLSLIVPVIVEKFTYLSRLAPLYGVLGFALIASVFVFGKTVFGATNWITIAGIGLQPSELAKIVFVFFMASMLYRDTGTERVIITSIMAAVFVLMLVMEKDLGAAVIFFVTYIVMLYVAGRSFFWPGIGLGMGAAASVLSYFLFSHVRRRVVAWRDPWGNYQDAGYQISQSLFAIATGGWFGMGLMRGMPGDIPVVESDFIFSVIAEELGGAFSLCLILIYLSCFIMFINISLQLTNNFYKLLAIGLSVSYGFQTFLCIGGVIKFIPHTGVTMPLISYGGSSILSTIIVFAVIQGLYLHKIREVSQIERTLRQKRQGR